MKLYSLVVGLAPVLVTSLLQAQVTEMDTYTPNLAIPDGNATGVSDSHLISSSLTSITGLSVNLDITGSFNGDLYVYLRHEQEVNPGNFVTDGFAVLLNRVGRTSANASGYGDSGFNVTLTDSAPNGDIHNYQALTTPSPGNPLTGTWQPDARNVDPGSVLDTSSRTAFLNTFDGLNPNGRWTLFGADLESGGTSQIVSWQLEIAAVPEPQAWAGVVGFGLAAFALWRRRARR